MMQLLIKNPRPDFFELKNVLGGKKNPDKIHFVELWIDEEIKKIIIENCFNEKNVPPPATFFSNNLYNTTKNKKMESERYYKQLIKFRYQMGYSFLVDDKYLIDFMSLFNNGLKLTEDTAKYTKGKRVWAQESVGLIKSWEDFEKFPWNKTKIILSEFESHLEFLSRSLPKGMKVAITGSLFEQIMERILGYENFFYLIYDQPDLVKNIVDKVGQIMCDLYSATAPMESVGILLLADDLAYKTSTIISVDYLRKWFFPWYKKYSSIAHKFGKHFWYHCCGNKYEIMEELIANIKIDAIHGFEDSNSPITTFKEKYGNKIALLGGVDMDKLVRLDEVSLRNYIKYILNVCMVDGRFALGSGNSFCNYIPIKNYFFMIEEGLKWKR